MKSLTVRATKPETRCKTFNTQVGEEKNLREEIVQEKGELVELLENAQRLQEAAEE